jgi:hypothetical protein
MPGFLLFVGGLIIPAVAGAMGYSIWIVLIYAAVFHLIARSSAFRSLGCPSRLIPPILLSRRLLVGG